MPKNTDYCKQKCTKNTVKTQNNISSKMLYSKVIKNCRSNSSTSRIFIKKCGN